MCPDSLLIPTHKVTVTCGAGPIPEYKLSLYQATHADWEHKREQFSKVEMCQ